MDAKESLRAAIAQFRNMAKELGRFMADSEQVFLATGTSLARLENEANRVLTASSSQAGMATGESDPVEGLRKGLGELDQHLEKNKTNTDSGVRALAAVLSGIEGLSRLDGEFQTIVATLYALASTTHLENSRQGAGRGSFDSVVGDLRAMAVQIKPKFGQVLAQGRQLRTIAESALARARLFLDRLRRDVTAFREETRKQLSAMADACQLSRGLADGSRQGMSSMRDEIGVVLQTLQVQDIARQMLEHVVENLEEFATSAQGVVDTDPPSDQLRSWLAELALVTRVEAAQLANACDRLIRSLSQIDNSLRNVVASLAAVAQKGEQASGRRTGSSVFGQLERGIRSTTKSLSDHDARAKVVTEALATVCSTANGMQELVEEVAQLGEDARFIGLNAMVKAVRVGQAGATLTVLAREVQTVSDQIQGFTSSAASIMQSVAQEASRLVQPGGEDSAGSVASGDDVAAKLKVMVGELETYQSSLDSAADMLLSGNNSLRIEVDGTSRTLRGLVEQAKALRKISDDLSSLHNVAAVGAQGARPPGGRRHNEDRLHTMEEERHVRRQALGQAADGQAEGYGQSADTKAAEGSVEFF